jgi:S-DNA-T family DNA segregation ATPase FtsK/SpoIIIE
MTNRYIEAVQAVTAKRCPRSIREKKDKDGRTVARIPEPWKLLEYRETEHAFQMALHVPTGYSAKDIRQETDAIYAAVGAPITIHDRGGVVVVSISKKDFPEVIPYHPDFLSMTTGRTVLLGFDLLGNPVTHNFRVPHLLMGAMPGYGKTDMIRWMIFQLISRFTPDEIHIDIVDGKGFSFLPFRGIPHIRRIVRDIAGVASVMSEAKRIMNQRSKVIWENDDRSMKTGFRWHMVFIDELAVLSPSMQVTKQGREVATMAYADMAAVACVGREASVGMVVCTQRPDANVVHPQVKQAMDASIAFRVKTLTNSEIILDRGGAELLPQNRPGRGIYSATGDTIFQAPYVGDDDAWSELLEPYKTEWRETEDERSEESEDHEDVF